MAGPERQTTTLSTKGQVILPKAIRDLRRWAPGAKLNVQDTPEGVLLTAAPAFAPSRLDAVFGSLKPAGPALSVEDMDAAIAREAARRARD
jgi:AbrB family looped-hinge helix DNA binding protein